MAKNTINKYHTIHPITGTGSVRDKLEALGGPTNFDGFEIESDLFVWRRIDEVAVLDLD